MFQHTLTRAARGALAALALAAVTATAAQAAAPFSRLFVLGDSLSDNGNAAAFAFDPTQVITGNTYVPSAAYASGTLTNGSVWATQFAAKFGITLAPAVINPFAMHLDTAVGGAESGSGLLPPGQRTQASGLVSLPGALPGDGLYVLGAGSNDARGTAAMLTGDPATDAVTLGNGAAAYGNNVAAAVIALYDEGARDFILWNVPDLGLTPFASAVGPLGQLAGTATAQAFNQSLAFTIGTLSASLPGASIEVFDLFGLLREAAANPAALGLTNVTDACGAASNACDPTTALFWDGIHPTTFAHGIIAERMYLQVVPEPESLAFVFAGGMALMVALRRRSAATAA
jgi:outer membrane lipase/esterase